MHVWRNAVGLVLICASFGAAAQNPAQVASIIKDGLVQCGEFVTPGFPFENYREPDGKVSAGRQQDIFIYRDVRDDSGVLTVTQWIGHRRDFQPYGTRVVGLSGYITTMTARVADISPNPEAHLLTEGRFSRGLWGVHLTCRSGNCFSVTRRTLNPADLGDWRTPLSKWQPSGVQQQDTANRWIFEICAGGGGTSEQNAKVLQQALQLVLKR